MNTRDRLTNCQTCLHNKVCKYTDEELCIGTKVKDLITECKDYTESVTVNEWISVEDRLPEIDKNGKGRYGGMRSVRVICACKQRDGKILVKEGYYEPCANGNVFWRIPGTIDFVTHWMPLPKPPKEVE